MSPRLTVSNGQTELLLPPDPPDRKPPDRQGAAPAKARKAPLAAPHRGGSTNSSGKESDQHPDTTAKRRAKKQRVLLSLPSCAVAGLARMVDLSAARDEDGHVGTILLKGVVGKTAAVCLFDTGAEANFLSKHFVDKLELGSQLKPSRHSVRYADGSVGKALGEIELPLHLLGDKAPQDCTGRFIVADLQRQFDLILGIPFCRRYDPLPDWDAMTISLKDPRAGQHHALRRVYKATARDAEKCMGDELNEISLAAMDQLRESQQVADWFVVTIRPVVSTRGCTAIEVELPTAGAQPPLSAEELKLVRLRQKLMAEYASVFPDALPPVDPKAAAKAGNVHHHVTLVDGAQPHSQPLRRLSTHEMDELKKQLQEYLDSGRIRTSESPWGANVIFVKKKDGSLRFCVDYRGLNERTVKNKYPLPLMDELFDRLQGAKYFSKIDLRTGFYQILMAPEDSAKTAFRTRYGLFEWTVLPMGLTNAPATFQHLMNSTFREFLDVCVLVFLDDIVVYSHTLGDHERDVRAVLQRLKDRGLYAKAPKCDLFRTEIEFLGHRVGSDGLRVLSSKVDAVRDWPQPQNATDLRAFLGLTGFYRRFIEGFSHVAAPLHELTQSKPGTPPFKWTAAAQAAFDELKKRLQQAPVLALPDPDKAYVVHTDARPK